MPAKQIVLNASPLILLCNGELDFILPELFDEIVVPTAVWQEVTKGSHLDRAADIISGLNWLQKENAELVLEVVWWDLGVGETEVLSFAFRHRDFIPVMDDMLAKKCANSLELPTMGTGSILILAKEKGLIKSVEQSLRKLKKIGLWISEPVIEMLKREAGE